MPNQIATLFQKTPPTAESWSFEFSENGGTWVPAPFVSSEPSTDCHRVTFTTPASVGYVRAKALIGSSTSSEFSNVITVPEPAFAFAGIFVFLLLLIAADKQGPRYRR